MYKGNQLYLLCGIFNLEQFIFSHPLRLAKEIDVVTKIHFLFIWVSKLEGLLWFLFSTGNQYVCISLWPSIFCHKWPQPRRSNCWNLVLKFGNFSLSEKLYVEWVRGPVSCGQGLCLTTRGILSCKASSVGFLENHLTLNKDPKSTQIWPKYLYCLTLMETWLSIPPRYLLSLCGRWREW